MANRRPAKCRQPEGVTVSSEKHTNIPVLLEKKAEIHLFMDDSLWKSLLITDFVVDPTAVDSQRTN